MNNRIISLLLAMLLCGNLVCKAQVIEKTDTLSAARVVSDKQEKRYNSTQTGLQSIDASRINRGFALFNSPDIIKTLQTLPGVAAGTELMSGLYVHGGDGSDNLFLLDGVPIYQVGHLIGMFSAFNSDVVDNLDFYKSGFPARYGGRASSVVDIKTRDGDFQNYHGTFSIGLIDGRMQFEGPIGKDGKTSFNVGLRRTWLDTVTSPLIAYINNREIKKYGSPDDFEKIRAHYAFTDFNTRVTHKFAEDNVLRFNFYIGGDNLPVKEKDRYKRLEGDYVADSQDTWQMKLYWGNTLASLSWDYALAEDLDANFKAYWSHNKGNISFDIKEEDFVEKTLIEVEEAVKADVYDSGVTADFDFTRYQGHHIRFGGAAAYHRYAPDRHNSYRIKIPPIDSTQKSSGKVLFQGAEGNLYAEDEMTFGPLFRVNAGLRLSLFGSAGKIWAIPEPRIAGKYQCGANTSIKLSYAEMSQYAHQISTSYMDLPTNTWMPSTAIIKPMRSRQVAGGVYSDFGRYLKGSLEGWYKTMDNLYEYIGTNMLYPAIDRWENEFTRGKGRSWGLEASLEYESEKLSAQAYYTLSWSQRRFDDIYFDWYADRNDNRHKITLQADYSFTPRFHMYAGWNYHTGNRVTAASYRMIINKAGDYDDIYSNPNNLKLPDYHRLDVGFNFTHKTKRDNEATWNLSVYNAYCRMNAIFGYITEEYKYDPVKGYDVPTGRMVGAATGLIPIIPTLGYTLKF